MGPPGGRAGVVTCGRTFEERQQALYGAHGRPKQVDGGAALRLLGLRDRVHPIDVVAFAYRDQAAADAYAASNAEHHGLASLGTAPCDGGVVGVLDLRPALAEYGRSYEPADPRKPDHWFPPASPDGL
jgi:hypothetical protein